MSDDVPVRTSLNRVPSSFTPAEFAERETIYEGELWRRHRVVVVRLGKPQGLPRLVTMALEAWAKGRFERRST